MWSSEDVEAGGDGVADYIGGAAQRLGKEAARGGCGDELETPNSGQSLTGEVARRNDVRGPSGVSGEGLEQGGGSPDGRDGWRGTEGDHRAERVRGERGVDANGAREGFAESDSCLGVTG
jgi:hypothetical protein